MKRRVVYGMLHAAPIFAFLSLAPTLQAYNGSDFLVVENVDHLLVYNKYQQEITDRDRTLLVPFVPMRILKADDFLSDGFTRCMQVEISGETFFLLKDAEGKLTRSGSLAFESTFHNSTIILDTIQILTHRSIRFSPINSPVRQLPAGEKVIRFFRHQKATYCGTMGTPSLYGWIDFTGKREDKDWKVFGEVHPAISSIPVRVIQRIEAKIDEVNHLLARLFGHFNTETHQQKKVPQWIVDASGKAIICTLQGPTRPEDFQQSTLYLVKDFENMVMGTGLRVSYAPGRIDIRQE